ncbi:MAG: hypothetical protein HY919_02915 [Elusimicrobia bacterium]|nr:hypothetical protein [Elusimicrobiota bacterium]
MEQSKIQGENQQESRLWWLGGIIDGEGCITITHHRLHKGKLQETLLFSPQIIIVNTNKKIINYCEEILRENNLSFYISYISAKKELNYKEKWSVKIVGIKRCVRALNLISKYLIGKKEEAELVKIFCEERLRRNIGRMQNGRKYGRNEPYNDTDFKIIMRIAEIHNRNPQRLYAEIGDYKKKLPNKIKSDLRRNP